jgi:DNA-binding beta-propeller fold protein YncE
MNSTARHIRIVALAGAFVLASPAVAVAAVAPIKETLTRQFGWDVNRTKVEAGASQAERNVCTTESKDQCVVGEENEAAGGFGFPPGVAVETDPTNANYGDIYVADQNNGRIQIFTPTGMFVSMFGWNVNRKGGNTCTATEESECRAAQSASGGPAGQIMRPTSITVDPATGDLYILDVANERIEKYTSAGEFLFMTGRGVNKKGGNICAKLEESECQAGLASEAGSIEAGGFKPEAQRGNLLAVGASGVLYVGDEGRVQKFKEDGTFIGNILIAGDIRAIAVDSAGELYVLNEGLGDMIHKFDASGQEVKEGRWPVVLRARDPGASFFYISTLTIDPSGRLAANQYEVSSKTESLTFGSLLDHTGRVMTNYRLSSLSEGVAFAGNELNGGFAMYTVSNGQQVSAYAPSPVAEMLTGRVSCVLCSD